MQRATSVLVLIYSSAAHKLSAEYEIDVTKNFGQHQIYIIYVLIHYIFDFIIHIYMQHLIKS